MTTYLPPDPDLDLTALMHMRARETGLKWHDDETADIILNLERAAGFHALVRSVLRESEQT
ncbi:hypothetical protein [Gluconacetobacter sacchari]|uniref:Uncharacterized protein n=1 Tax=Gluconacetobacter sacchari TaxID=92759 RepID=A0A7W4IF95_9PROT|nr:hypothetical protein [Gluconacetobacter sacchari]MBB2161770.1 hypothetical protein [Gluconacetobacter sacchari]